MDGLEVICGCCELCLYIADAATWGSKGEDKAAAAPEKKAQASRLVRTVREEKRGVRLTFEKKRIGEIEFVGGPMAGKRASELSDMELKRLALSMPHRTARFALRRYLRHRKKGTISPPREPVIRR
jgi:hypothetical protein